MKAVRLHTMFEHDGELVLTGLPYRKGQQVELILFGNEDVELQTSLLTADKLLNSGIVGLWKDRTDIEASSVYARQLGEKAATQRNTRARKEKRSERSGYSDSESFMREEHPSVFSTNRRG